MFRRFGKLVIKLRWVIVAAFFLLFIPASDLYFVQMPFDNSIDIWFDQRTETMHRYHQFREMFESDSWVVVALHADDIFTSGNLELISRLTRRLKKVKDVGAVKSITNAEDIEADAGGLVIEPFVKKVPTDPAALAALKAEATANELYLNNYISADGKTAAIFARVETNEIEAEGEVISQIVAITREETAGENVHFLFRDTIDGAEGAAALEVLEGKRPGETAALFVGMPVSTWEFDHLARRDNDLLTPLITVVILLILFATIRKFTLSLVPYMTIFFATLFTMAIFVLTGFKMNTTTNLLPPLIMSLAIAVSIHIVVAYLEARKTGLDKNGSIVEAFARVGLPCLFTTITTAVGFGSFLVSDIMPLRTVGMFTALGVFIAYLTTFSFNGAAIALMKPFKPEKLEKIKQGFLARLLDRIVEFNAKNTGGILIGSLLIVIASGVGISRLVIETASYEYMKSSNWLRISNDFLEKNLGGLMQSEILFNGEPDFCLDPEFLVKIDSLERFAKSFPEHSQALSLTGYLSEIHRVMSAEAATSPTTATVAANCAGGGDPSGCLPQERNLVAQYLLLAEAGGGEDIADFVNLDRTKFRVSLRSHWITSRRATEIGKSLARWIDENMPEADWYFSGAASIYVELEEMILQSQIKSFSIAFAMITLMMIILVRDVRTGLLSMIPNLAPIAFTLGFMGFAGIRLDTATVMIASVAIGISVDDTIHYLHRFREELEVDWDYVEAMRRTTRGIGRAIVFTSVVLFCGFIVMVFGSFVPSIYFGLLTALTMLVAVLADLILMPALLIRLKPFGSGDDR